MYRTWLQDFLRRENIGTVLDAGAGDWQSSSLINWSGIRYVGIDVVPDIVRQNRRLYGDENISFVLADMATDSMPPADLLIVKDVLQHWPDEMILAFLKRLDSYRYVLLINDVVTGSHRDIALGNYRPLDLSHPPFSFPVTEVLRFSGTERLTGKSWAKSVCLYRSR